MRIHEPLHRGRCYLHGHEGETLPLQCQTNAVQRVARALISYL